MTPITCSIHVGIPALGKGPAGPRKWHAVQRNLISGMMHRAGYAEIGYQFHGHGEGATIVFGTVDPSARPGEIPDAVQAYLDDIGVDLGDVLRRVLGVAKVAFGALSGAFPQGEAFALITAGITEAERVVDAADASLHG